MRLKHLQNAPASVKFVSFEPLLGCRGQGSTSRELTGRLSAARAVPRRDLWPKSGRSKFATNAGPPRSHSSSNSGAVSGRNPAGASFAGANGMSTRAFSRIRAWEQLPPQSTEEDVTDPYSGREQTKAKHFILRSYLQALAFKVLTFSDIAYVDGFSGPWETKTENFSNSSFMIAISVLQDAQKRILARTGNRRRNSLFLLENDAEAFAQLQQAVARLHKPEEGFEIKTYCGKFEDAVSEIQEFVGISFPLIFIDPTGWTGYPLNKIKPLFARPRCEVLINFMYEFVNRFAHSGDEDVVAKFVPILGGPGWRDRLDPSLHRGRAVEKLFRETLRTAGSFDFVISTKIDKATAERPYFFITYGTKSRAGLIAFRETEYAALREHAEESCGRERKETRGAIGHARPVPRPSGPSERGDD